MQLVAAPLNQGEPTAIQMDAIPLLPALMSNGIPVRSEKIEEGTDSKPVVETKKTSKSTRFRQDPLTRTKTKTKPKQTPHHKETAMQHLFSPALPNQAGSDSTGLPVGKPVPDDHGHRRSLLTRWWRPGAFAVLAGLASVFSPALTAAETPRVVASFSILGDLVQAVGGDAIQVTTLVGPDADAHVYQPTPQDSRTLKAADLLVVNGLGFEAWLDRLVASSGFSGRTVVASEGVVPLKSAGEDAEDHERKTGGDTEVHHDQETDPEQAGHHGQATDHEKDGDHAEEADHDEMGHPEGTTGHHHHGDLDPHAWQSIPNVIRYVENVRDALSTAAPDQAEGFRSRASAYIEELRTLDAQWRAMVAALPPERRLVITSHDAFGYLAETYGLRFEAPQGVSTDAEASAADVAALIRQIRAVGSAAVFVENMADDRIVRQIQRETGARVGGTLYADALSAADGEAPSYLAMMRHNLNRLQAALQ